MKAPSYMHIEQAQLDSKRLGDPNAAWKRVGSVTNVCFYVNYDQAEYLVHSISLLIPLKPERICRAIEQLARERPYSFLECAQRVYARCSAGLDPWRIG